MKSKKGPTQILTCVGCDYLRKSNHHTQPDACTLLKRNIAFNYAFETPKDCPLITDKKNEK